MEGGDPAEVNEAPGTPTDTGDEGTSSLLITSQREVSQVPEKDTQVVKPARDF